jgi:hypothetical protein
MRFFENWWERVPTTMRFAPLLLTLISLVLQYRMDYYWE